MEAGGIRMFEDFPGSPLDMCTCFQEKGVMMSGIATGRGVGPERDLRMEGYPNATHQKPKVVIKY